MTITADLFAAVSSSVPAVGAGGPAGTGNGNRLELRDNNVLNVPAGVDHVPPGKVADPGVYLSAHRCRCRTCKFCGGSRGYLVRERLLAKQSMWRSPKLLTLTVDRKRFASPQAAWEFVASRRLIAKLMAALGIKLWVWVLEFQQKTGDGWPHWHLVIDVAELRGGMVDLARAWELWNRIWEVGGVDLAPAQRDFQSAAHALNYITKYLTKHPQGGYPVWVLESDKAIRFVQGCRKLGALVADKPRGEVEEEDPDADDESRGDRRPLLERMSECKTTSTVWRREVDASTGEANMRYLCSIPVAPFVVHNLTLVSMLDVKMTVSVNDDKRSTYHVDTDACGLVRALNACEVDLFKRLERVQAEQRVKILEDNRFAKRSVASGP